VLDAPNSAARRGAARRVELLPLPLAQVLFAVLIEQGLRRQVARLDEKSEQLRAGMAAHPTMVPRAARGSLASRPEQSVCPRCARAVDAPSAGIVARGASGSGSVAVI
jgi:hypothetical protein